MKTIKFDLPIDGVNVANVDDLGDHLTTEILDHFRSGVLSKWLRARRLEEQLAAVEKLPEDGSDRHLLLELCKLFQVDADEHSVAAALATPTDVPGVRPGRKTIPADGGASGRLTPGGEDKWRLEVPNATLVTIEIVARVNMVCALENTYGVQLAIEGDEVETKSPRIRTILSEGIYYVRLKGYCDKSSGHYNLVSSQKQKFTLVRANGNSVEMHIKNLMEEKHMDGIYNATGRLKEEDVDIWVMNEMTNKIKIGVRSSQIADLAHRIYDGYGQFITTKLTRRATRVIEKQFGEFIIAVWSTSGITGNYSLTLQTYSEDSHKKVRSLAITLEGKGMSPTLRKKEFFWPFTDYRYHPDES